MKNFTARDYTLIALVAALYVVLTVTPPLNAISYGPLQFRISEMLNLLIFFNRRYIYAVTMGVVIANLFNPIIPIFDPIVGGLLQTGLFLFLSYKLFNRYREDYFFNVINKAHLFFAILFSLSMILIASELVFAGFTSEGILITYLWLVLSEFVVIMIGSVLFDQIGRRIDLTK
ncbi:MAG: QueT transporter family protein [Lactovum sp.]